MSESTDPVRNLNDHIKLNVGGKLFETTLSTIRSGGPDSLLYALSNRFVSDPNPNPDPIFIDRDPEIFSVLLYLLRSNHLPSTANRFSKQELTDEAYYYGIDAQIKSAMSPPPFHGIDASVVETIRPASDGLASSFTAAADDGSLWVAHGGQISSYDWNLIHSQTIRTHVDVITSICRVWPEIAAVGSESDDGLHFYDISSCRHVGSVHWTDPSDPRIYKARVPAIADSVDLVFGSFDCPHKENCILAIDKSTLQIVSEFGRQSGNQTKHMVAGKLSWVPGTDVLVGSGVMCGAFGYSGYIRMWDPRSGNVVWDTNEPGSGRSSRFGDSFAAADVDNEELKLFKVCSKSGDLGMADMRKLSEDPWVYLKDKNPSLVNMGGTGLGAGNFDLHCYKRQVFVGRDGSLEVWSQVKEAKIGVDSEREVTTSLYRRNFVDKVGDSERGTIKKIEGGGNRLFVSRENAEGVEVWESSYSSGATTIP